MEINKLQRVVTEIQLISSSQYSHDLLKLVTKILLPFSVLSVIFLCDFYPVLAYGLQLFSFSVGKNYMFLLCNGILVFIATSSGLIGSFPVETSTVKKKVESLSFEKKGAPIVKAKVIIPEADEPATVQESKNVSLAIVEDEEEQRHELVSVEEHEDEGLGLMSDEELNKKCDEFIRKIKEGIRFEAL